MFKTKLLSICMPDESLSLPEYHYYMYLYVALDCQHYYGVMFEQTEKKIAE